MLERVAKTRKSLEVRMCKLDHACRLTGDGGVDRPRVKIRDLVGREEREAAASANYAGNIVGLIEMRRNDAGISNPYPWPRRLVRNELQRVFAGEAGQDLVRRRRSHVDVPCLTVVGEDREKVTERRIGDAEIEAVEPWLVKEAAAHVRFADECP